MHHALILGVDDYADPRIPALRCASRDASAFAQMLERELEGNVNIALLLDGRASRAAIEDSLDLLLDLLEPRDHFIFYFAGHGCMYRASRREVTKAYLAPHDMNAVDPKQRGFELHLDFPEFLATVRERAASALLIIDSCFAPAGAPFARSYGVPNNLGGGYCDVEPERVPSYEELQMPNGSPAVLLAATQINGHAYEDHGLGHGLFTHHLLRKLESAKPPVTAWELGHEVAREVLINSSRRQVPTSYAWQITPLRVVHFPRRADPHSSQ